MIPLCQCLIIPWWSTQSRLTTLFSSLIAHPLYDGFNLKTCPWGLMLCLWSGSPAVRSKAVVLLLLTFCLLLLPLWESVIDLCFVVRYFMSILVLQSSWWGRGSWLLCLVCLPGVLWRLGGSSSRCRGVVCSLWLWYFLIILTYYF